MENKGGRFLEPPQPTETLCICGCGNTFKTIFKGAQVCEECKRK